MRVARVLSLIAITVSVACAEEGSDQVMKPNDGSTSDSSSITGGSLPWEHMVVNGITVSSAVTARDDLAFPAALPSSLGAPDSIQMTDPRSAPKEQRGFGAMFNNDGTQSLFWILEQPAEVQPEELLSLARPCDPEKECEGTWTAVDLGGGVQGVLIAGPEAMSIRWIFGGVQFDVIGPADSLSSEEVKQVAETVASEAQTT